MYAPKYGISPTSMHQATFDPARTSLTEAPAERTSAVVRFKCAVASLRHVVAGPAVFGFAGAQAEWSSERRQCRRDIGAMARRDVKIPNAAKPA